MLVAAAIAAAVALTSSAIATTPKAERSGYVDRLESICKPGVEATQRAVRGVRSDIQAERLAVAAAKLGKAARIFDGTVHKISAVPRPASDATHLAKWFRYLKLQESYLGRAAAALPWGPARSRPRARGSFRSLRGLRSRASARSAG